MGDGPDYYEGFPEKYYEFECSFGILKLLAPKALTDQIRQFEKRVSSLLPNVNDYSQIILGFPDEPELV